MFTINKLRVGEGLLYGLLWAAIFSVPLLNAEMTSRENLYFVEILGAWSKTIPYFGVFLVNNFVLLPLYQRRLNYWAYILMNVVFVTVIFSLVHYAQVELLPMWNVERYNVQGSVTFTDLSIIGNSLFALIMNAANAGIKLMYKSVRDDQKMAALERHNLQVEMDYLKYQVNPHFFMNTLNNIHALIDIDTESAKSAVVELSKMMRHVLYESGRESIPLRTDMQFIKNYIELMRIRYDGDVEIEFDCSEVENLSIEIPPLLLIVFVENAFKHGAMVGDGFYIRVAVRIDDQRLRFEVANSHSPNSGDDSKSGIGLVNVRKRLELLYGANFELNARGVGAEYLVNLVIPVEL